LFVVLDNLQALFAAYSYPVAVVISLSFEPSARSVRAPRKALSTTKWRVRAARVQESGLEMSFRC
ncbi:hypothetical protein CC86DRAFT_431507, partial [Ophiobolus disseminans]